MRIPKVSINIAVLTTRDNPDWYSNSRQASRFELHRNRVMSHNSNKRLAKLERATRCRMPSRNSVQIVSDDEFFDSIPTMTIVLVITMTEINFPLRLAYNQATHSGWRRSINDDDDSQSDRRRLYINNRELIQPDRFNGVGNTDLVGFLDHFEACADYNP